MKENSLHEAKAAGCLFSTAGADGLFHFRRLLFHDNRHDFSPSSPFLPSFLPSLLPVMPCHAVGRGVVWRR